MWRLRSWWKTEAKIGRIATQHFYASQSCSWLRGWKSRFRLLAFYRFVRVLITLCGLETFPAHPLLRHRLFCSLIQHAQPTSPLFLCFLYTFRHPRSTWSAYEMLNCMLRAMEVYTYELFCFIFCFNPAFSSCLVWTYLNILLFFLLTSVRYPTNGLWPLYLFLFFIYFTSFWIWDVWRAC